MKTAGEQHYTSPGWRRWRPWKTMRTKGEQISQLATTTFPKLTHAETTLLRAATIGKVANCGWQPEEENPEEENDPLHSDSWGEERTIRAVLIRWLCIDEKARGLVDPKGLRIKFAKIDGKLDLSSVTIPFPLVLLRCSIPKGVDVAYAKSRVLNFEGSVCGPWMGNGLAVEGDLLLGRDFRAKGAVELNRARITGRLDCSGGKLLNLGGMALNADAIEVGKHVLLRQEVAQPHRGFRAEGQVWLVGATIGGYLICSGGVFHNPDKIALYVDGSTVRHAFLRDGFRAEGLVHFAGSNIGGNLDFRKAQFHGKAPYNGLIAEHTEVTGLFDWREILKTDDLRLDLFGARVGQLADDHDSWPTKGNLDLEDFTYTAIIDGPTDAPTRRQWLERQSLRPLDPREQELGLSPQRRPFSPKPYQQLAKV